MADTAVRSADERETDWIALTALSVGRVTDGKEIDRRAQRVMPGETVTLTAREAQRLNELHRVPVVQRKGDGTPVRVTARQLFNPPVPAAALGANLSLGTSSSRVIQTGTPDPALSPEATDPDPLDTDPDAERIGARGTARARAQRGS